jgi:predicted enzyme related to lactoylglutathione lyase
VGSNSYTIFFLLILSLRYQICIYLRIMAKTKTNTSKKMHPVVHFEMPVSDRKRSAKFYSKTFGWDMNMLGKENRNYTLASTSESSKSGVPKKQGMINGGFYEKNSEMPAQYPSVVIAVDNLKTMMKKVTKAGGEVLGEPRDVPGYGKYVSFYDTEGNRVAMMEPSMVMEGTKKVKKK